MRANLVGESGISGFPWRRDDYGERMITLPGEVDGRRVRIAGDVRLPILAQGFTASEIDDCPAILAAIRNAVLPEVAIPPSEHMSLSDITSSHGGGVA
jgi:hypothetical protein